MDHPVQGVGRLLAIHSHIKRKGCLNDRTLASQEPPRSGAPSPHSTGKKTAHARRWHSGQWALLLFFWLGWTTPKGEFDGLMAIKHG